MGDTTATNEPHFLLTDEHIGISGLIGVGKTTFCCSLAREHQLEIYEEPSKQNPYLEDFYENMEAYSFKAQIWFITARYARYKEAIEKPMKGIVQDRILFEDSVFASMLSEQKKMNDVDFGTYKLLYEAFCRELKVPDFVIYLDAPAEHCMERIKKRGLGSESKITLDYLRDLERHYRHYISEMGKRTRVFVVDWTTFRPVSEVINAIHSSMQRSTSSHGVFNIRF